MPVINDYGKRIEARIRVKSIYEKQLYATHLTIKIPTPKNTANVNTSAGIGRAKFEPAEGGVMWRCKKFPGDSEFTLTCNIELS